MDKLPVPVMRQLLTLPDACRALVHTAYDELERGTQPDVPALPEPRTYGEPPLTVRVEQGRRHIGLLWQKHRYRHLPVKGFYAASQQPRLDADEEMLGVRILDDPAPSGARELRDLSWDTQYYFTFFIDERRQTAWPLRLITEGHIHQRHGVVTFSVHLGGYGAVKHELTEMNSLADMLGSLNKKLDLKRFGIDTGFLRGEDDHARTFEKLLSAREKQALYDRFITDALLEREDRIAKIERDPSLSQRQREELIRRARRSFDQLEQRFKREFAR